jgi:hypothetical protein
MDTKQIWDAMKQPPKEALREIKAGRLKGMSDINPQWRLEIMTEIFGPIGKCWSYDIDKMWTQKSEDGQESVHIIIKIKIANFDYEITGLGGSMLIAKEKNGLYHNDEAYKMALTDALSVALKQLGVAADIYAGKWDGSKYKEPVKQVTQKEQVEIFEKIEREIMIAETLDQLKSTYDLIRENNEVLSQKQVNGLVAIGKHRKQELEK